jgi:Protein of unknown function (DUF2752)
MKNYFTKLFHLISPEAIIWIFSLLILAFIHVDNSSHFTICPFKNLGIDFCPGCGLGKSIHYLLHFDIDNSLNSHPLGVFAFAVLIKRIFELTKSSVINVKLFLLTNRELKYEQSFTINAKPGT